MMRPEARYTGFQLIDSVAKPPIPVYCVKQMADELNEAPTIQYGVAIYDWQAAFRMYLDEGLTLKAVAERIGAHYETVREKAADEKWSLQRQLASMDTREAWESALGMRILKQASLLSKFEPESIEDLQRLTSATKTHIEAGRAIFGLDKDKQEGGPSALVQVNVSTGHAADTGSTLRSRAAKHARQAKPAPPSPADAGSGAST
jgi:hypothetical protein